MTRAAATPTTHGVAAGGNRVIKGETEEAVAPGNSGRRWREGVGSEGEGVEKGRGGEEATSIKERDTGHGEKHPDDKTAAAGGGGDPEDGKGDAGSPGSAL